MRSQRGNLMLALALTIMGAVSVLSMLAMVMGDTIRIRLDIDRLQEDNFLRSEVSRSLVYAGSVKSLWDILPLPEKRIHIRDSKGTTTYLMKTKISRREGDTYSTDYFANGFKAATLVKALRGTVGRTIWNINPSLVSRYGETMLGQGMTLSAYHYITDQELMPDGKRHYFWGPDVYYGRVHSNDDIWLKQAGGGNNNGWPTFHGPVSTSGCLRSASGAIPMATIFLAGFVDHAPRIEMSSDEIRAHGRPVGPTSYDPNRILFLDLWGSSFGSHIGYVYNAGPDTADVWTRYPPRAGTYLFRNRWTRQDTVWTTGPCGVGSGHSNIVFSKLWIKGRVYGKQTWCAVDTVYLVDDCYLSGTPRGQNPDGTTAGSILNTTDFLGIVSEKSILIQYGYKDPCDSVRYHPNCDGNQNGIWIYAALCALGNINDNPLKAGVFTFEYQHPHPSTPAGKFGTNNYIWDKIDLHRRRYPQTAESPWPMQLDYPWYNPLWPERTPYLERGTVHLYGAVAQKRVGYLHRSYNDMSNSDVQRGWNIPLDMYGGASNVPVHDPVLGITMQAANAPSASGAGIGYAYKDYHYDNRFTYTSLPDYPPIQLQNNTRAQVTVGTFIMPVPSGF